MSEEFKPKRLTKKSLLEYLDTQIAITNKPDERSEEERMEDFKKEWKETNEKLKLEGIKKAKRRNVRQRLKQKYGLIHSSRLIYTKARLAILKSIKNNFDL